MVAWRRYLGALIALWVPTIGEFCVERTVEQPVGLQSSPLDLVIATVLLFSLAVSAALIALAVSEGLRKASRPWQKAVVVFIGVFFGAANLAGWVLSRLWFYIDVMHRDSL
jgi:hypothetical protein